MGLTNYTSTETTDFKLVEQKKGGRNKQIREAMGIRVFRFNSPCLLCGEDMRVAPGQVAYYHAGCRTEGRKLVRKSHV